MENKLVMRDLKLVLVMIVMVYIKSYSQAPPFDFILYGGLDPNMLINGAYPDREDPAKGFDYKVGYGFDWEHIRLRMEVQSFEVIHFTKWTYMAFDYKLNPFKEFYLYGGVEVGQIKRRHIDYLDPKSSYYRENVTNPVIFGLNGELQYRFNRIGLAIQANIHQAEDDLKKYKSYRFQVHAVIIIYL